MKLKFSEKGILLTLLHEALDNPHITPVLKGRNTEGNREYIKELIEKIEKEECV